MLDVSYFQSNNSNVQIFQNAGSWQTWIKPRGAKIVYITVIGAGAGGGGGLQSAGTRSGGAGGGSGAMTTGVILANVLPDILYIFPGRGGAGGIGGDSVTNTNGNNGESSYICLSPDTGSATNIIIKSGNVAATGGTKGTTTGTPAGTAETSFTITSGIFSALCSFDSFAGQAASNGSTTAAANLTAVSFTTAGPGGGGTGAGGGISSIPIGTALTGGATNTNGKDGIILYKPVLFFVGGTGGGGNVTGGKGGNGAPGCGGGGGGGGSTSAGNGGNGGNGLVIIKTIF